MHHITPEVTTNMLTLQFVIAGAVLGVLLYLLALFTGKDGEKGLVDGLMVFAGWGMIAGVILMVYGYWFHSPNHIIFAIGAFLGVAGAPYHMYQTRKEQQYAEREKGSDDE